ncbi:MFS transporter [Solimonas marina]|uniref:MFS transporter n=1 Tax=Solimonas marina TaxID=2714601 RepID=UPI001F0D978E|nr:MFS transporter [Solimonas marina]
MLLLTALYLAQGLPFGFFVQALPVMMRDAGYSLLAIGATGLLSIPWVLKFLWAPYVDRYGTRRRWLLWLQGSSVCMAAGLAALNLTQALPILFVAMLLFNLIAATQDIATDGLTVRLLDARQRGLGNGIQVGAYRLGMVFGGGVLLWLYARTGWTTMFLAMAALLLLCSLPVWTLRDMPAAASMDKTPPPTPLRVAASWWPRLRQPGMPGFVLLICLYKFGDSMGASLIGPFMKDQGLTLTQIAWLKGALASATSLLGAAAGGWLAYRVGRRAALLFGGLTQTASLVLYGLAAIGIGGYPMIAAACIAEHVLGGIATVALFTLMMDASDPAHAGTDYTLLACVIVIAQGLASMSAAAVGQFLGYPILFASSTLLSGLGCAILVVAINRGVGPARLHTIWPRVRNEIGAA